MPVYSQEATQHVTRVSVYAFVQNGSTYLHQKTYDITGWTDGTTFKRFAVPDADKLPVGVYKFLAVGRDASDYTHFRQYQLYGYACFYCELGR